MDPDAKIQVATLGTALYYSVANQGNFIGNNGSYNKDTLRTALGSYTRVYGLSSTPDFGGQPNTIDTTTLDNTKAETSVLGLQPSAEVTYEVFILSMSADVALRLAISCFFCALVNFLLLFTLLIFLLVVALIFLMLLKIYINILIYF